MFWRLKEAGFWEKTEILKIPIEDPAKAELEVQMWPVPRLTCRLAGQAMLQLGTAGSFLDRGVGTTAATVCS